MCEKDRYIYKWNRREFQNKLFHIHVHVKSLQSCPILCNPVDCTLSGSSVQGILQGKKTGMGCHALLQESFPGQGSNPHLLYLLHWQAGSLIQLIFNKGAKVIQRRKNYFQQMILAHFNTPASNLENSAVATGLEKVSFHSSP